MGLENNGAEKTPSSQLPLPKLSTTSESSTSPPHSSGTAPDLGTNILASPSAASPRRRDREWENGRAGGSHSDETTLKQGTTTLCSSHGRTALPPTSSSLDTGAFPDNNNILSLNSVLSSTQTTQTINEADHHILDPDQSHTPVASSSRLGPSSPSSPKHSCPKVKEKTQTNKVTTSKLASILTGSASTSSSTCQPPLPPAAHRILDPLNIPASARRVPIDEPYSSSRQFSPSTPVSERSITRRRLSNPVSPIAGPSTPPRTSRKKAPSHSQPGPSSTPTLPEASNESHRAAWFPGNFLALPHHPLKANKSDDEREDDPPSSPLQEQRPHHGGKVRKKRLWLGMTASESRRHHDAPLISMTPPSAAHGSSVALPLPVPTSLSPPRAQHHSSSHRHIIGGLPSFIPLPNDPNNILPLSVPSSPVPSPPSSRQGTPFHTPHPSLPDLAAEYASGPSGSSGSPRTSISTSSSRVGWPPRSDSRSSSADEDSPILGYNHHGRHPTWWWKNGNSNDVPVSPKILTHSGPSSQPRGIRSKFVPTGTRNWGWLLELVLDTIGMNDQDRKAVRSITKGRRNRERDRLMMGKRRSEVVAGLKWADRIMAFVPTTPTGILASILFFALLTLTITKTLMYILNPDKEALPWRQYCQKDYPTLYALQDSSTLPGSETSFFPFGSTPPNLVLAPLTHDHAAWPYRPHTEMPYSVDSMSDLRDLSPVGVFVGVFTTDSSIDRRNLIRQSYASHWRSRREGTEGVRVRFVMGRPRTKFAKAVKLEMEAFDDILLLDIPENMNSGKTHAFFSWAAANATVPDWEYPALVGDAESPSSEVAEGGDSRKTRPSPIWRGERVPEYVVKADDDAFIMLGELERRLRVAPRTKAYWGYMIKNIFMGGECYGMSMDLVKYIADSTALRSFTRGKEDRLVGRWMKMHPQAESIVWVSERCWIYDHPKAGTVYSHGFLYPSEVHTVRVENSTGLSPASLAFRGGPEAADAYSSVSKFGSPYRTYHNAMSASEQIEALVEGSPLSRLRDEKSHHSTNQAYSHVESMPDKVARLHNARPSRSARYLDDPEERGGTVVVHFLKKPEWFVEAMIAMLGTADDQAVWHRGVGNGLGLLESRKGRVVSGKERQGTGVHVGKDGGL